MATPQVLMYCANEPSDRKYRRRLSWLQEGGDSERKLAERLAEDLEEFPKAVSQDLEDIRQGLLEAGTKLANLGLVVATNHSVREGAIFCGTPAAGGMRRIRIGESMRRVHGHPLSHADMMSKVMHAARAAFSEEAEISVVTKSHGSRSMALTSLQSPLLDASTKKELFSKLRELQAIGESGTSAKMVSDKPDGTLGIYGLGIYGLGVYGMGVSGLEAILAHGAGSTKRRYLESLSDGGTGRNAIATLVMESCESQLTSEDQLHVPSNVRSLFTTKEFVPYNSISYSGVLRQVASGASLAEAFSEQLPRLFDRQR